MPVHVVNTLEISVVEDRGPHFEQGLRALVTRCEAAPGCLGYALTRHATQERVWILSGHWENDQALTAHYRDASLEALLGFLIEARASLSFSLFQPTLDQDGLDGTR